MSTIEPQAAGNAGDNATCKENIVTTSEITPQVDANQEVDGNLVKSAGSSEAMWPNTSGQDGGNTQNRHLHAVGEGWTSKSSNDKKQVNLMKEVNKKNVAARKEVVASVLGKRLDRYKSNLRV